ncbi:hypothetical protein [Umezakia ovalisporum]|uniref:hypothetical protein n=1 Tax=Umezakia ovalisporum TaxID=75695 RepID=UPI002473F8CF|nr:hypothetical protein [Umezakia ovalisporum]MDH6084885.1 hypothetical protein [Umezakia ovalisporum TAC611]
MKLTSGFVADTNLTGSKVSYALGQTIIVNKENLFLLNIIIILRHIHQKGID